MGKRVGYWKTHPKKDLQALLFRFHKQDWTIFDPPTYYKTYCACIDKHKKMIHLTPSDPNYGKNQAKWLERQTCYSETKEKS